LGVLTGLKASSNAWFSLTILLSSVFFQ
jgi:hypothetical protein